MTGAGRWATRAHAFAEARATPVATRGAPPTSECETRPPAWIWCDDFERDRLDAYFEYDDAGGSFQPLRGSGVGSSVGMTARFRRGQVDAGHLHVAMGRTPQAYFRPVDEGTERYREIFWRIFIRNQQGWVGGGGAKLSRATVFASEDSWAQAMIAHVWTSSEPESVRLVIDPASGTDATGVPRTTTYNDFANLRWLGSAGSSTPIFDSDHVGQWYCVEAHVRLNDAGRANGGFRLWIDEILEAERTDLDWLGSFASFGLNAVFLENYWDRGSPAEQERTMDNFVVSTERIGCG